MMAMLGFILRRRRVLLMERSAMILAHALWKLDGKSFSCGITAPDGTSYWLDCRREPR